ncbi:MAG: TylF/MycF/NovP-related O-methyltransferase [Candidatus Binataceae bacterium]
MDLQHRYDNRQGPGVSVNSNAVSPHVAVASFASTGQPIARRGWMAYERTQRFVGNRKLLRRVTLGLFAQLELIILRGHKDPAIVNAIRRCRRQSESLLTGNEAFFLYSVARAQSVFDSAMAEVGVFEGSSARIICEAKRERPLHLFDTFAGMPEPSERESHYLKRGQYSASLMRVRSLLRPYSAVHIHPGLFPASAVRVNETRFSFVHIDVDLYSSTLATLEFFYPRMIPGGVILTHDYSTLPGVAQGFSDFFSNMPGAVIELPTSQAMFIVQS